MGTDRKNQVTHTHLNQLVCPDSVRTCEPSESRHTRAVLSALAVIANCPSGVTQTLLTDSVCPDSVRSRESSASRHTRAVLSLLPVITHGRVGSMQTLFIPEL